MSYGEHLVLILHDIDGHSLIDLEIGFDIDVQTWVDMSSIG